jgi:hypothetical protein
VLRRYASCRERGVKGRGWGGGGVQLRIYKNHVRYVPAGQVVHSSNTIIISSSALYLLLLIATQVRLSKKFSSFPNYKNT